MAQTCPASLHAEVYQVCPHHCDKDRRKDGEPINEPGQGEDEPEDDAREGQTNQPGPARASRHPSQYNPHDPPSSEQQMRPRGVQQEKDSDDPYGEYRCAAYQQQVLPISQRALPLCVLTEVHIISLVEKARHQASTGFAVHGIQSGNEIVGRRLPRSPDRLKRTQWICNWAERVCL
jgi:hypothetical protein